MDQEQSCVGSGDGTTALAVTEGMSLALAFHFLSCIKQDQAFSLGCQGTWASTEKSQGLLGRMEAWGGAHTLPLRAALLQSV